MKQINSGEKLGETAKKKVSNKKRQLKSKAKNSNKSLRSQVKKEINRRKRKSRYDKLDPSKYTPLALMRRGLTASSKRKLYSELRKVATDRQRALKKAGLGYTKEAQTPFMTLKQISQLPSPEYGFNVQLMRLVEFLINPLSHVSTKEERAEYKAAQTLKQHGHEIAANSLPTFGQFMKLLRTRITALEFDSERAVQMYEDLIRSRKKVDIEKLADSYEKWLVGERKTYIENIKLLHPTNYIEHLKSKGEDYQTIMDYIKDYENRKR